MQLRAEILSQFIKPSFTPFVSWRHFASKRHGNQTSIPQAFRQMLADIFISQHRFTTAPRAIASLPFRTRISNQWATALNLVTRESCQHISHGYKFTTAPEHCLCFGGRYTCLAGNSCECVQTCSCWRRLDPTTATSKSSRSNQDNYKLIVLLLSVLPE